MTSKQLQLLRFIENRVEETGVCPSFEEMKQAVGLRSKSGVHRLVTALEERRFIRRLPNRARAIEIVTRDMTALASIPTEALHRELSRRMSAHG